MKKYYLYLVLLASTGAIAQQNMGFVLSSTPITKQISIPHQTCPPNDYCSSYATYETRTVGYNVIYEFAGRQYTSHIAQALVPRFPCKWH